MGWREWRARSRRYRAQALLLCALFLLGSALCAAAALFPQPSGDVYEKDGTTLDVGGASSGYVMLKRSADAQQRVRVSQGGQAFTYSLRQDGEFEVYPLQLGSGEYEIRVYEQVRGDQYAQVYSKSIRADMPDENLAFLYPNQYVWYTPDSTVVSLSQELCSAEMSDKEKLTALYTYVVKHITYDYIKAATVQSGYMPDLEVILQRGNGICFDIASLLAAMLRVQGVPAQIAIGNVHGVYHAWNRVYLDGEWSIVDATLRVMNYGKEVRASDYRMERYY